MHKSWTLFAMLALAGCPYVDADAIEDLDGDGLRAIRFEGGRDCDDNDPMLGDCDPDRDGVWSRAAGGTDCDDMRADISPLAEEICDGVDNDCDGLVDDFSTTTRSDSPPGTRTMMAMATGTALRSSGVCSRSDMRPSTATATTTFR